METIALAMEKGGVLKTSGTYNLAAIKASEGKKVLMVDMDPQASLTISCGMGRNYKNKNISGMLSGDYSPLDCTYTVESLGMDNFYIIPSDISLSKTEIELFNMSAREHKLSDGLDEISQYFDYCFIDCPPQLSILSANGLVAADKVLIPCKTDYLAYMGLQALIDTIHSIQGNKHMNPKLEILGIIATVYEDRVKDQQDVWELLHEVDGVPFLGTIRKSADGARSVYKGTPVVISQPKSKVSQDYFEIASKI